MAFGESRTAETRLGIELGHLYKRLGLAHTLGVGRNWWLNGMWGERHLSSLFFLPDITLWGMELGLLSMRRGELARFLFKPTYAYGTLGCPPLIPPNATVLFEIELIDFLDSAESDKFCALSAVSSILQIFQYFLKGEGLIVFGVSVRLPVPGSTHVSHTVVSSQVCPR